MFFLLILTVFVSFAAGTTAFADDGSWSKSFALEGGSIYSETENPDIELKSELLVFDGERTTAFFLFKNNSAENVKVICGFPVRSDINSTIIDGYAYIWTGKYSRGTIPALKWFSTVNTEDVVEPENEDIMMEAAGVVVPVNENNRSRNFARPEEVNEDLSFSIYQDGRRIKTDKVLIDRYIETNRMGVIYHFQHVLEFGAGQESVVKVEYTQDLFESDIGAGLGKTLKWDYIISTGRTWSDAIGNFCLAVPSSWDGGPANLDFAGTFGGYDLYYKKDYEPRDGEYFTLSRTEQDPGFRRYQGEKALPGDFKKRYTVDSGLEQPTGPVRPIVSDVSASSALKQNTEVFTAQGVLANVGFAAYAAFDGYAETAWCEGVSGDGMGEYLQFTLTGKTCGMVIQNGFIRFQLPEWVWNSGLFSDRIRNEKAGLRDYFNLNGSVSKLDIVSADGKTLYTLDLMKTREAQLFLGFTLEPGTYRAVIRGVYRGTKWKDTCLGEITFIEADRNSYITELAGDDFLMSSFRALVEPASK